MKFDFEMKRVLFGLTAILKTDLEHLPPTVTNGMKDIMIQIVELCGRINEEKEKECNADSDDDEGEGEEEMEQDEIQNEKDYKDTLDKVITVINSLAEESI
jgi:hypothetical protein